ncbi:ABC transporter ATP-binding protein [Cruoricaptor ignavus]|uniref:ABC transporter ATP-binding protein n=1 Tax=Cruoricaptor ignavus TaxID=1118202 RepID=A0A7M1T3Z2_9FLAO|nr:ABC transporter ATP-binding protein [Cruoricaptor ignavus]QOR74560.1 ABC transporter ATP-binding protein [Cruoricaptor ignavus]
MLLEIRHLHFSYSPEKPLFQDLNLEIGQGKIVAVAGESGCGKTSLLSLIYGLLDWQSGEIFFDGKPLFGPKRNLVPGEKEMKLVAQDYDLLPYSTAAENVGKFLSNSNLALKKSTVEELLWVVGMQDFADVKPQFLSGGQQQRIAIARALSVVPKLLLLDEPFSNIDFSRRAELRENVLNYAKAKNISVLISTHNLQEILPWLDEIIVMENGKIIAQNSPQIIYNQQDSEYIAKLFGEVNVISAEHRAQFNLGKKFYFPHEIQLCEKGISAEIIESLFAGSYYRNRVNIAGEDFVFHSLKPVSGKVQVCFSE